MGSTGRIHPGRRPHGCTRAWSAEAWGADAIVPLAYLAAKTERIRLGTGIMQISSRVPSMIAMTAQSLDTVSNGRFNLGLGVSGPQVVEGLHGAKFAKPLSRLRECVDILRMGLGGEKLQYDGEHYTLPRPGGEGKPIRLSQPPRPNLPIYLATLGPRSLQMTGEVADGWLGTCSLRRVMCFWMTLKRVQKWGAACRTLTFRPVATSRSVTTLSDWWLSASPPWPSLWVQWDRQNELL